VVSLTGSDSLSGLDKIIYKINNGGWNEYKGSFTLDEGSYQLWVVAVDNAGNTMEDKLTVKVDTNAPTAGCTFNGEGTEDRFYRSVDLCLYGVDAGSGVDEVYYRLGNTGNFGVYKSPITVDSIGSHTVDFYAVDKLGNEGSVESKTFSISPVNFEMNLKQPNDYLYVYGVQLFGLGKPVVIGPLEVEVSLESFTDNPAEFDQVEFFLDGSSMKVVSEEPFVWNLDLDEPLFGGHSIRIEVVSGDEVVSETAEITCIIP